MAEIQPPYMNRIKRLAGLQATKYEYAYRQFLSPFERADFESYGQRYLRRLDTMEPRTASETNLQRINSQVRDSSLRALALQLHLSGDEESLAILTQASVDRDPSLVTRPLEVAVRNNLKRTALEYSLDLRSYGKKMHPVNGNKPS